MMVPPMRSHPACTAVLVTAVLAAAALPGCRRNAGASPKMTAIAQALVAACNRQSPEQLDTVQTLIGDSVVDGTLSSLEAAGLAEIIETARSGDWVAAEREARQVLIDQARPNR